MTTATQIEGFTRHKTSSIPLPAAVAALGIVYGDIGTSPLYAFKQAANAGDSHTSAHAASTHAAFSPCHRASRSSWGREPTRRSLCRLDLERA